MNKRLLLPISLVLLCFGTISQAQILPPPDEDTVGHIDVGFRGYATAYDGELLGGIQAMPLGIDIWDIDPNELYTWCFDVGLEYRYRSNAGSDEGRLRRSFELGDATPAEVLEYLFTAPPPGGPPTAEDVVGFYNGIPGFTDVSWFEPLGIAAEDFYVDVSPTFFGLEVAFGSDAVNPRLKGEIKFRGLGRLSIKQAGGGVVPEPSTYGMIGAGFLVVLVFLRRRAMADGK